jgi:hypothetical protein
MAFPLAGCSRLCRKAIRSASELRPPFLCPEVQQLHLGVGARLRGEGILAITKALLEHGVGCVAGYQGRRLPT